MTPINQAAPDPPDQGTLLNAWGTPKEPKPRIKGVTLLGHGERVQSTAALKVTMRRGGGGRRRDELWRGGGGSEKSCGYRHEAPQSPIPRAMGGDSWPDPAPRRKPRNPLTFTISECGHGRRRPARGPPNTPTNFSPNPMRSAGHPSCQDPAATTRPLHSTRPPARRTCPIASAAGGPRSPLTYPAAGTIFLVGKGKGGCGRSG